MLATQRREQAQLRMAGPEVPGSAEILTPEALDFVAALCAQFTDRIEKLLARRQEVQRRYDAGELPNFLPETEEIRRSNWRVAEIPEDLRCRTVELTGPVDPKMIINALESGADMFMADFEDASAPSWVNMIGGQAALRAAVRRELEYTDPRPGASTYATALGRDRDRVLVASDRVDFTFPRRTCAMGGRSPCSARDRRLRLVLFPQRRRAPGVAGLGSVLLHARNCRAISKPDSGATSSCFAERTRSSIPRGSIRATVLIETLPAAFEMDEILYELRDYIPPGLNCGRWDYIFSYIKTLRADPNFADPARPKCQVGMTQPFMRAYTQLRDQDLPSPRHLRDGRHGRPDPDQGTTPTPTMRPSPRSRADKEREARRTATTEPGSPTPGWSRPRARSSMRCSATAPNQIAQAARRRSRSARADLHRRARPGTRTEAGLRLNVPRRYSVPRVWLRGQGCVPLYHLMEDAATAEISRAQVWQWQRHGVSTRRRTSRWTPNLGRIERHYRDRDDERTRRRGEATLTGQGGKFAQAATSFSNARDSRRRTRPTFLTLPAYEQLLADLIAF